MSYEALIVLICLGGVSLLYAIFHMQEGKEEGRQVITLMADFFGFQPTERVLLRLQQAGFYINPVTFAKYICSKIFFFICILSLSIYQLWTLEIITKPRAVALLTLPIFAWFAIDLFVLFKGRRRIEKMKSAFPQCIELIVLGMHSGLTLGKTFRIVADEIKETEKELAQELFHTAAEMEVILDKTQALTNLSKRIPTPVVRSFVTILSQSIPTGSSVSENLAVISEQVRKQTLLYAEIRAQRTAPLLALPLVIFIMPVMIILLVGSQVVLKWREFGGDPLSQFQNPSFINKMFRDE